MRGAVAQRCGSPLDGMLRRHALGANDTARSRVIFSRIAGWRGH
jgi:hypothetical protein